MFTSGQKGPTLQNFHPYISAPGLLGNLSTRKAADYPRKVSAGLATRKAQTERSFNFFSIDSIFPRGTKGPDENRSGGTKQQRFGLFQLVGHQRAEAPTADKKSNLFAWPTKGLKNLPEELAAPPDKTMPGER